MYMPKAQILIVEDESIVAKDIKNMLERIGYDVPAVVASGEKAIEKAAETSPDLVLMDIMLKGDMDGVEAAEQIRSRFYIPVVYVTAYADDGTLQRAKITEPFGYIIKPFQERELHTTIEMALYRHKMERKLKESEQWLSTTLRSIGDAVISTDTEGCVTFMNPVAQALTGWNQEEATGKPLRIVFNIVDERTGEAVEDPVAKVIQEGEIIELANHTLLIARDGTRVPIDDSAAPIRDDSGNLIGVVLVFRDITERKRTGEALRESEEKYRTLVENANETILVAQDGMIKFVNPKAIEITGYSKDEVTSRPFMDFIHPDDREMVAERYSKRLKGEELPHVYPLRIADKCGNIKWVELNAVLITWSGKPATLNFLTDITERKRTEEALRESEEMFRAAFETAEDCIFIKDRSLKYIRFNPAMVKLFGVIEEELINKTDMDLFGEEIGEQEMESDRRVVQGEIVEEESTRSVNGVPRTFHIIKVPLRDSEGNIFGLCGIARDITERQKMEAELLRIQKLESIGILAGGIAHDFNNILTGILGNISLAGVYTDPGKIAERLSEAEMASLQAKNLTQQLLTFSKGGAPIKETTAIADLVTDSAPFALRGSNVRCEFSIPDDLWAVEVDEGQIRQVVNNLIINADQAMPGGGVIEIRVENVDIEPGDVLPLMPGKYIKISIQDHGIGISEEHLHRIFDPYYTTKQKGSGLGLATSYSIIKNHGGHITVESQIGIGTTFYIYLPASAGATEAKKEKVKEELIPGSGKVLVMDDEKIIRDLACDMLASIGYEISVARDGAEAVGLYKEAMNSREPFDAVIMDLTVQGSMGGKEAVQELLKMDPDVKAIVSSGYSNDPIMADFRKYGFMGVIAKPYKIKELSEVLHRVMVGTDKSYAVPLKPDQDRALLQA
jgi:PAS domain S-box-containing protein